MTLIEIEKKREEEILKKEEIFAEYEELTKELKFMIRQESILTLYFAYSDFNWRLQKFLSMLQAYIRMTGTDPDA